MHKRILLICVMAIVTGCTEILRKPNLLIDNKNSSQAEFSYSVKGFKMTPEIVSRANQSSFTRYVSLGGGGTGAVQRVPESKLFNGPRLVSNVRPEYKIGIGDTLTVVRPGHGRSSDGVRTKQTSALNYVVNEKGTIDLLEGFSVKLEGLSIEKANSVLNKAYREELDIARDTEIFGELPKEIPPPYSLGVGDVLRVTRLIESTSSDGIRQQSVLTSESSVGSNGVVSILQLGEVEALGLTLPRFRDRVLQEAIRNTAGTDTVVEIQDFVSKSALVTGDFGSRVVPITDQPLSYDKLLAEYNLSFADGRDYLLTLERLGETYQTNARSILQGQANQSYVFDGDRVTITAVIPPSSTILNVANLESRHITYLRVTSNDDLQLQQGISVPYELRGIDLRQLLIGQGIDVTQNRDLLVTVNRGAISYKLSAQEIVFENPGRRYWLYPDDHVTVEDIAYVGDNALLVGEIGFPRRLPINQHNRTTLAEALFESAVFTNQNADFRHVYVLRGSKLEYDAFHFDFTKVLNLSMASSFELRPGDIMFVRTRPLSRYTSALALALGFANAIDAGITNSRTFGR